MTTPAAITFCNAMRDTAVDRAEADWQSRRHEFSFGTRLERITDGALVVSVMRKQNGLYQARWTLNGREISRPDAEDAVERHLTAQGMNTGVNNLSPEMETPAGETA